MKFLTSSGQILSISSKVAEVLPALVEKLGTRQKALKALKEFVAEPVNTEIGEILKVLKVDEVRFRRFLGENEEALTALLGDLGDLAEHQLAWELSKEKKVGKSEWSIDGSAGFKASIDVDVLEEAEKETPVEELGLALGEDDALVAIGVEGTVAVGGKASAEAPLAGGVLGTSLAFDAGSSVLLENCFLRRRDESALAALREDIEDFKLPLVIDGPEDLRHLTGSGVVIPTQWIHLRAAGHIRFGAALSWGHAWVNSASVKNNELDVNETVKVTTGLSAAVSVSHELSGAFDLVVAAARTPGMVRVSLEKSRTAQRQVGLRLDAGVKIVGLDKVGRALLNQIQPAVDEVIKKIEEEEKAFPTLKELITDTIGAEVDKLLAETEVDEEIATFLEWFGKDPKIKERLKELAEGGVLKVAGADIEKLDENIEKVRSALKALVSRYRGLLKKVDSGLQKAADLKIAAAFARTWHKLKTHETALLIDIDPRNHVDAYHSLLRGDFAPAIEAFQAGKPGILIDGKLKESGALKVTTEVSFSLFGLVIGSKSALTQEWEMEVSPAGEVMLAVASTYEISRRNWRQSRTASFMVDGRLVDTLASGVLMSDQAFAPTVTLELGREAMPAREKTLKRFENELLELGVAEPPLDIRSDVLLPSVKDSKNRLSASIVLELEKRHLEALLEHGLADAERAYATSVVELGLAGHKELQVTDSDGIPFLLWKSVQKHLATQNEQVASQSYRSDDGSASVRVSKSGLHTARRAVTAAKRFRAYFSGLAAVHVSLRHRPPDEAVGIVKQAQKDLLQSAKGLFIEHGFDLAFFRTVFRLANSAGDLDPVAVVTRTTDDRVFFYG